MYFTRRKSQAVPISQSAHPIQNEAHPQPQSSVQLNSRAQTTTLQMSVSAKKCTFMKSRNQEVNSRMEKVLTKWKPRSKSINERYE